MFRATFVGHEALLRAQPPPARSPARGRNSRQAGRRAPHLGFKLWNFKAGLSADDITSGPQQTPRTLVTVLDCGTGGTVRLTVASPCGAWGRVCKPLALIQQQDILDTKHAVLFCLLSFIYFETEGGGERGEREPQAGSELSAQSPTQGSSPQTGIMTRAAIRSRTPPTELPGSPFWLLFKHVKTTTHIRLG